MSRSKKTRTKSIDHRLQHVRLEVAAEAARIIATEGQQNYHAAKKKAAARRGVSERLALPSNLEIKDALRTYLELYRGSAHTENLARLRRAAVAAMHWLDKFTPRLVGSVLDGTANEHSRAGLHIFADSTESVILHFLENGKPFSEDQRQIRWYDGKHRTVPLVIFEQDGSTMELTIFEPVHLRQSPPCPINGKPQRRASLAEAKSLLTETHATSPEWQPANQTG